MENSADPRQKPADLDLHCFLKRIYPGSAGQRLKFIKFPKSLEIRTPGTLYICIAPITYLRMCIIKIVTFKGGHLM